MVFAIFICPVVGHYTPKNLRLTDIILPFTDTGFATYFTLPYLYTSMTNKVVKFVKQYAEAFIWSVALLLLFFMNTEHSSTSLCLLKSAGFKWCPGCGLGHSIHYALHLNWKASIEAHILGIPAAMVLLYQIFKSIYSNNKKYNYGPATTFKNVS